MRSIRPLVSALRRAPDLDRALALIAFLALLLDPVLRGHAGDLSPGAVALALLTSLALLVRRRYAIGVLIAVAAGLLASLAVFHPNRAAVGVAMLAVYTVGLQGRRVRSLLIGAAMAPLVVAAIVVTAGSAAEPGSAVAYIALVLVALAAGDALRGRRALKEAAAAAMQHRLDEQRLRMAHEVHDTIAHALVGINVRAAAAVRASGALRGEAVAALEEITQSSADALAELRATLKMLRPGGAEAPLHPAQSLADLEDLIDGVRSTGLAVETEIATISDELSSAVGHAAYRIVQEGLTNILRHSTADHAVVRMNQTAELLTLEIADDGRPRPRHHIDRGHGLQGMAERAGALGGSCEAGPVPGGGWRVVASLPVKVAAS